MFYLTGEFFHLDTETGSNLFCDISGSQCWNNAITDSSTQEDCQHCLSDCDQVWLTIIHQLRMNAITKCAW